MVHAPSALACAGSQGLCLGQWGQEGLGPGAEPSDTTSSGEWQICRENSYNDTATNDAP
ncbi:hypothetical protein PISMIDRAFT_683173 [Pisolithus microcarpus 441]|uniref:Uncharacterized protein n=1 Tax=Pisolithus microcarpus 441 TaxID=765257 RepID=A0A0C9YS81_9AGAM|nr:hypothetical protein PISMIDRAFT_683173 [Pisolithus microcarpus 441]